MKEHLQRIFVVLALTLVGAFFAWDVSKYRLGPDLSGGTILVYEAEKSKESARQSASLSQLVPELKDRLDPSGLYNYVIRPLGADRIEIIMPNAHADDIERVKRIITRVGELKFRILANRKRHADLMDRADNTWPSLRVGEEGEFVPFGKWVPYSRKAAGELAERADKAFPEKVVSPEARFVLASRLLDEDQKLLRTSEANYLVKTATDNRRWVLCRWDNDGCSIDPSSSLVKEDADGNRFVLVYMDTHGVTGEFLTRVEPTVHEGALAVAFTFDARGGSRFWELTGEFQPEADGFRHQLGVVLDGRLRSAPSLNQRIRDHGVISGSFTHEEIQELKRILETGQLPITLVKEPSSQYTIAPTLGADTIRLGVISTFVALVAVIVFMVVYYHVAGIVAVLALLLNLLLTVALMVMFKATWTLPGLAGLVLTVGMAVDANVLIYERMREELERGASLSTAIRLGYDKAWVTIFDSNLTTILTAVILFIIGTDQVRGFAVTLILGIATSMYCALTVTRVIFDVLYSERILKKLTMMKAMTRTNFDFVGAKNFFVTISLVVIGVGMLALLARGVNNFDIDFTGGTMARINLTKPMEITEVRKKAATVLADVAVEEVRGQNRANGTSFVIRTSQRGGGATDASVTNQLIKAFGDVLEFPKVIVDEKTISELPKVGETEKIKALDSALQPFAGGQVASISFESPRSIDNLKDRLTKALSKGDSASADGSFGLAPIADSRSNINKEDVEPLYTKFQVATKSDLNKTLEAIKASFTSQPEFEQFSEFGPQVAGETTTRALWAILLSWIAIILYVWLRFGSWAYGLGGVVALVHDVLAAAGMLAVGSFVAQALPGLEFLISDMKIDLNVVAALLTLIGYSINDTIVIFDRIREVKGKSPKLTREIVNQSLNETLSRTIITAVTVFITVTILYFGGGPTLRGFSFVLVVGVVVGSYSSLFIACPVLLYFLDVEDRREAAAAKAQSGLPASSTAS